MVFPYQKCGSVNDGADKDHLKVVFLASTFEDLVFITDFVNQTSTKRRKCQSLLQEWCLSRLFVPEGSQSMEDLPRFHYSGLVGQFCETLCTSFNTSADFYKYSGHTAEEFLQNANASTS